MNNQFSGTDINNYQIEAPSNLLGKITAKDLFVNGIKVEDRGYDGTNLAVLDMSSLTLGGLISGDEVIVSSTGTFSDKHAEIDKEVAFVHDFTGSDLANYLVTAQTADYATIQPRPLSITGIKAVDKIYDGDSIAEIDVSRLEKNGLVFGDQLELSSSASFADKTAGTSKPVTYAHSFSGSDLNNYLIDVPDSDVATIFKKPLKISGLKALDKIYDGDSLANIDSSNLIKDGLVTGDEVLLSSKGLFDNQLAEENKLVTITNQYSGEDVENYLLNDQTSDIASIFPRMLKLIGVNAVDKYYDGTNSVEVDTQNAKLEGLLEDDVVNFVSTGKFLNNSAESDKTVALTNIFSGSDLPNYEITNQVSTTATINRKVVSLFGEKIFDGKDDLEDKVEIITGVPGESLSYAGAMAASPSVAGPDGEVGTADNFISSITLMDATDGSGGVGSNYILPELNPENAPVNISASTIVIEESINAQMFDISASGQEGFINNVEYGISAEPSVSIESTVLPASGITPPQGASSSSDGVNQTDNEMGMKIEMVAPPGELSTGIVAVTIPQSTAVAGTGFSFGLPDEISTLVSNSQSEFSISLESGAPLPSWINYNSEDGKFVSSAVPDGAFPLKVVMNVDGKKISVVISERQE